MDFFIADTHFWHKRILHLGKGRPFSSIEEMNEGLIKNWNSVVSPDDDVFILGDFGFCAPQQAVQILQRLNGVKHLIVGNHDRKLQKDKNFSAEFYSVQNYLAKDFADREGKIRKVVLFHYPMEEWESYYYKSWHLYGHTHQELPTDRNLLRYHVGVDTNNYTPISFFDIADKLNEKQRRLYGPENTIRKTDGAGRIPGEVEDDGSSAL